MTETLSSTRGRTMRNREAKALAVLTGPEWEYFFPADLRKGLEELLPGCARVDPQTLDTGAWHQLLRREKPEVLIACWKTPSLPDNVAELTDGQLRYVSYLAGSVRKVVSEKLVCDGLLVTNWGNSISRVVAECGLMMAVACLRRAHQWAIDMHLKGAWKDANPNCSSLFERRVGIHGFGAISQELRKLLVPFDVSVMTYSPSVPDRLLQDHKVSRADTLDQLFAENDVIFELAALTPKSRYMVKEEHLRLIPDDGVFVNIGRGAVVDEAAILRVAQDRTIQIALDVFEEEPLPEDHPFRGERNIMLLPHLGGPTSDRRQDSGRLALANLKAYLQDEPLQGQVSPEVYARTT